MRNIHIPEIHSNGHFRNPQNLHLCKLILKDKEQEALYYLANYQLPKCHYMGKYSDERGIPDLSNLMVPNIVERDSSKNLFQITCPDQIGIRSDNDRNKYPFAQDDFFRSSLHFAAYKGMNQIASLLLTKAEQ